MLGTLDREPPRLEGADTAGDHDRAGAKVRTAAGGDVESAVLAAMHFGHFLAEMKPCFKRPDLFEQALDELASGAHRDRRNVVDGLVRIELDALAARERKRIDDVRLEPEQPELEHLKQPHGPRTDDHDVGVDHGAVDQRELGITRQGRVSEFDARAQPAAEQTRAGASARARPD